MVLEYYTRADTGLTEEETVWNSNLTEVCPVAVYNDPSLCVGNNNHESIQSLHTHPSRAPCWQVLNCRLH